MIFHSAQCQGLKNNKPITKLKNEGKPYIPNKTLPNFRILHNSLPLMFFGILGIKLCWPYKRIVSSIWNNNFFEDFFIILCNGPVFLM